MPALVMQVLVAVALIVWLLAEVVLLLFFAVRFACMLRGAADWLAEHSRLPPGATLAAIAVAIVAGAGAASYWIAPKLVRQLSDLVMRLSAEWQLLHAHLGQLSRSASSGAGSGLMSLRGMAGHLAAPVETVLGSTVTVAAGIVVVLVTTLYLAAAPGLYVRGALHLLPIRRRHRAREVMGEICRVLQLCASDS